MNPLTKQVEYQRIVILRQVKSKVSLVWDLKVNSISAFKMELSAFFLMPEVPHACEYHRQAQPVGGRDYLRVVE